MSKAYSAAWFTLHSQYPIIYSLHLPGEVKIWKELRPEDILNVSNAVSPKVQDTESAFVESESEMEKG